jgi:hypothetical protein
MSEPLAYILGQLVQTGVLGAFLAWFMLRMENILKENTKAIQELREAILALNKVIH